MNLKMKEINHVAAKVLLMVQKSHKHLQALRFEQYFNVSLQKKTIYTVYINIKYIYIITYIMVYIYIIFIFPGFP